MTKADFPKIYVLSAGRSGTNLIYKIMKKIYPEFPITHQTEWSRLMNIIGNILLIKPLPSSLIQKTLYYLKRTKKPESTVDPLFSIPIAIFLSNSKEQYEYKIVHLVRDPRDFVCSFINWKNQRIRRIFLHHFVPFWQPNPVFCDNISFLHRTKMSKFDYFSWIWNFKNRLFEDLFGGKENYYLIRLEDLVIENKGSNNLKRLNNFLGFPGTKKDLSHLLSKKVNITTKKNFLEWRNWHSQQAKILEKYCGALMRKYGYGREDEWKRKLFSQ